MAPGGGHRRRVHARTQYGAKPSECASSRLVGASATLRQPGPFPAYVFDQLTSMMSVEGGYFIPKRNGIVKQQKVNGVVHHIGLVFRKHCQDRGIINGKSGQTQAT